MTSKGSTQHTMSRRGVSMQKGHCLCGNVQYEFDETQVGFGLHCHCKDCQRVTGSGKATVIM
ncbi:MAG: hypothetical protein VW842_08950, partial [Halieaceae bacterium]